MNHEGEQVVRLGPHRKVLGWPAKEFGPCTDGRLFVAQEWFGGLLQGDPQLLETKSLLLCGGTIVA